MDDPVLERRSIAAFGHLRMPADALQTARRRQARSRRSLALGVPAVALAVGVAIVGLSLSSAAPAEASWSAVPAPAAADVAELAVRACHLDGSASLPLVLSDTRARTTLVFYAGGGADRLCEFTLDAAGNVVDAVTSQGRYDTRAPAGLDIIAADLGQGTGPVMIVGRAPASAASVKVVLAGGVAVTTSVGRGFYLAWWPKPSAIVSVAAADGTGREIARLEGAAVASFVPPAVR